MPRAFSTARSLSAKMLKRRMPCSTARTSLSEHAQINTKPQLEIRADDVRCAHGASIGQLDQDIDVLSKTRGIDDRAARQILIRGFAAEILDRFAFPAFGGKRQTCSMNGLRRVGGSMSANEFRCQIPQLRGPRGFPAP